MKVIFDCIVTSEPERCSTTVQFITLAKRLLKHPGVFIYWPRPDRLSGRQLDCYPNDERIRYIPIKQYQDRLKEYNRISPELEQIIAFSGTCWDWDVMVTVRNMQTSMMRVHAMSPRRSSWLWQRRIILIENMMMLSKKETVAQSVVDVQDRMTLEGYLTCDAVLMPAYHQKRWVRDIAREHFAPHLVREISDKITEVCQLDMGRYTFKTEHMYKGDRKLNVAFVGRLEKYGMRLSETNDVFMKQYIMNADKVNTFVCTVTEGDKVFKDDFVDVRHPNRDEFWRICREEMDVAINMSRDVELNLSMLEPITFGVPLIVVREPWSVAMLGETYPFYATSPQEMHGLINLFRKRYKDAYAEFMHWFTDWFIPTYDKRTKEDNIYNHLERLCMAPLDIPAQVTNSMQDNNLKIEEAIIAEGGDDFILFEVIDRLGTGKMPLLATKTGDDDRETRNLTFCTPWNEMRHKLISVFGYEDASVRPGHFKRAEK